MKFSKQVFVALVFILLWLAPCAAVAVEIGAKAPDFELYDVAGLEVRLSDFAGRLVLLKLTTTWCPTCKELSSEIETAGTWLKDQDVVVLEVFVQDSQEAVKEYLGGYSFPMTYHALLDDGQAYKAYNVYLIPRLLLVDTEQIVRFDSSGRNLLADDLEDLVDEFGSSSTDGGSS